VSYYTRGVGDVLLLVNQDKKAEWEVALIIPRHFMEYSEERFYRVDIHCFGSE